MSYYVEETVFTKRGNYRRLTVSPEARRDLRARMHAEVSKAVCKVLAKAAMDQLIAGDLEQTSLYERQIKAEVAELNYQLYLCGHHPLTRSQLLYSNPLRVVAKYTRVFSPYDYMFDRPNPNN